jgi:fructose-bisphosphate aldolase class I
MNIEILTTTMKALLSRNKGILAADESSPTCTKRFEALGMISTDETRREYRELLLTAPGVEQYISGVILYDETIRQKTSDGVPFPEALAKKGIVPGIKVDAGAKDSPLCPGEKVTEGLDGLPGRLKEYYALGARFAKWRAVITIGPNMPTDICIQANAEALAKYAMLCHEADIVPIIEPEVTIDGNHTILRCFEVVEKTLKTVFAELIKNNVALEHVILKTSMVLPGKSASTQASIQDVAEATVKCLKESVPKELGGIVFLSGGQSDEQATVHLNAMNRINDTPWRLTFSYSRGIQNPVLALWAKGDKEKAMQAYLFRAKANSLASEGKYEAELENERPY